MAVLILVIGVVLLGKGIGGLTWGFHLLRKAAEVIRFV
jgi:hypothetical protein